MQVKRLQVKQAKKKPSLRIWLMIAAAIIVLVLGVIALPSGNPVRSFFGLLTRPIEQVFSSIATNRASSAEQNIKENALREENNELKQKTEQQVLQIQQLEEEKRQAEALADLAGFCVEYPEYTFVHARVINREPNSWFMQFTLGKGTKDGITMGSAVLTNQGLVGQVIAVEPTTCIVMAITDGRSNVACTLVRSQTQALLRGEVFAGLSNQYCTIQLLPENAEILPGELLVSTGTDGIYPPGFYLGRVSQIKPASEQAGMEVQVQPSVDFSTLTDVLIIPKVS